MAGEINRFVVFIPVRGGSKSIPKKNIKLLGGLPMVRWTLQAAEGCALVERVYVATDDEEIATVVRNLCGSKTEVIGRSPETATDTASTESAMLEFARSHAFEHIILMQATSPLTTAEDLSQAIQLYQESNADSLLSVVRQKRFVWETDRTNPGNNFIKAWNYDPLQRPRRQDFDGFLVENGAFYITSRELLLQTGSRLSGNVVGYEMDEKTYFEVDEPSDWDVVDLWLSARSKEGEKQSLNEKCSRIKMFIMDCDGVLTDAGMYYTHEGNELKKFSTRDGMGIGFLHKHGIKTAIITGENSSIVEHRARKLEIQDVYLGIKDKKATLHEVMNKHGLQAEEIAYIGDDLNDMEVLQSVGLALTVADATPAVKEFADYITQARGGHGAVREACEFLLHGQGTAREKR